MLPISLNIQGKPVLVVGGGNVAERKVRTLLTYGAHVTVISPQLTDGLKDLAERGQVQWRAYEYSPNVLEIRPVLAYVATNSAEVNAQATHDAQQCGIPVNRADAPEQSDFASLATVDKSPLTVAIGTGGASPALLALIKARINSVITDELAILAQWLGELRTTVLIDEQIERAQLYRAIVGSDVIALLESDLPQEARAKFDAIVAQYTKVVQG